MVNTTRAPVAPANLRVLTDADDYPCTYGTFNTICLVISRLPPGSQVSIRDVAEAYQTIPVKPSQWPGLVVRLQENDQFAINTSNNFGLTSAGGVYGNLADAGADLFRANGMGPVSKWVTICSSASAENIYKSIMEKERHGADETMLLG